MSWNTKLAGITCLCAVLMVPGGVMAQGIGPRLNMATNSAGTAVVDKRISTLQNKAIAEIDRRLAAANKLLAKLNTTSRLVADQKNSLISEVTGVISALTELRSQVSGVSDLASLRKLVKEVNSSYKIFAFEYPRIELLAAADMQSERIGKFLEIISGLEGEASNSATVNSQLGMFGKALADAQTQLTTMKTQTDKVIADLLALKVTGYPANRMIFQSARRTLVANNEAMQKMLQSVRSSLGLIKSVVGGEGSSSGRTGR